MAELFIRKFVELEECVTNLKLQKLLYYAQGTGADKYHCRLISDEFYAWEHGTVVKEVGHSYKTLGSGALAINPAMDLRPLLASSKAIQILSGLITASKSEGSGFVPLSTESQQKTNPN